MESSARNAFLRVFKTRRRRNEQQKFLTPCPRGAQKRSSPRSIEILNESSNRKRPNFINRGSVESLTSSVTDDGDWVEVKLPERDPEEVLSTFSRLRFPKEELGSSLDVNNNCTPASSKGDLCVSVNGENDVKERVEFAGSEKASQSTCEIYCYGPLLASAQNAHIYNDSKSFVDMKMKNDSDVVVREFEKLRNDTGGQPTDEQVVDFVNLHFLPPGTEFEDWTPDDWKESPSFLNIIVDAKLKSWASELNRLWKVLGRKITDDVAENSGRYSMIYCNNPVVVPGGRFREFYYWDNYWIVRGLLLSEMYSTVKGSIKNFLDMVDQFGFVPNGGRIYYAKRSQPPFLTLIVQDYLNATGDTDFLAEALPTLEREYDFWMTNRSRELQDSDGKTHILNRYASEVNQPRPESYREDFELIDGLTEVAGMELMSHITSACESGWDFSSRWTGSCYLNSSSELLLDLRTRDIIPVDLNSVLAAVERTLAEFHSKLGDDDKASVYTSAYNKRIEAIEKLLWHEEDGVYYDYLLSQSAHNRQFFASNVNPLWTKCYHSSVDVRKREQRMYDYLKGTSVLDFPGGIPTSLNNTGQQWDFPNAWPPLVHMIIEGMAYSVSPELRSEGLKQAQKWITGNWRAFNKTGAMFEKYDVTRDDGVPGGGGEYDVQTGFGWTNGVVMSLLRDFGDQLTAEPEVELTSSPVSLQTTSGAGASLGTFGSLVLTAAFANSAANIV